MVKNMVAIRKVREINGGGKDPFGGMTAQKYDKTFGKKYSHSEI